MTAQAQSSEPSPRGRGRGRPFQKGVSGNPGGRPQGLAAAVREKASAGELADYQLAIFHKDAKALKRFKIALADVTLAERTKAHEWLSERGYGKAPAFAPVEGGDPLELGDVDTAIAQGLDELAPRRQTEAAGADPGQAVAS